MTPPQALVDGSYKETSSHLLRVLHDKYHLMQHLKVCIFVCVCVCVYRFVLLCVGDCV